MDKSNLVSLLHQIKTLVEECLAGLEDSTKPQRVTKKPAGPLRAPKPLTVDFDKPLRPFIKQYAKGMIGSKKFVLLLSRLVEGDKKKEVTLKEIEKQWKKMTSTSLLAIDFNPSFAGRARENDWVESKKNGLYSLRPNWKKIFDDSNG